MSDAALSPLPGLDPDEELIFDAPSAVMIDAPAGIGAELVEPRPVARRVRKAKEAAASPEPVPASSMHTTSAEAGPATAEEPAGAPAPFPPQGANPAGSNSSPSRLLLATVALALLTSAASLGGLIAVSRTLAHAGADRTQAAADREALAGVPAMIAHLDAASARLDGATARLAATTPAAPGAAAAPPVTLADLHHEIDALKLALGARQPEGLASLDGMTHDGFSEMATRLDQLGAAIDQLGRRNAVSASRPASRAGDPRRPS